MQFSTSDPCCGSVSLSRGTKLIAMIDMKLQLTLTNQGVVTTLWLVTSTATGCFVAFAIIITLFYGSEIKEALDRDNADFPNEAEMYDYLGSGLMVAVLSLTLLSSILYFFLGQHLLHGAKQKDVTKVSRWFHITTALFCVRIMFNFIAIFTSATALMPFFGILGLIYTAYSLWVVHRFRQELLTEECYTLRQHPVVYKL